MGGQASAAHADRQLGAEATGHPQHLAFVGQVEAVTGFDFDAGDAIAHQAFQTPGGAGEQLIFAGRAGGAYGAGDATTACCDFRVADALQALLELTAAVPAEHRVGVAVDQARRHPGPVQISDRRVLARRQFSARANPFNVRTGRHDGRILDDRVDALRHGCDVAVLPEGFHPKSSSCSKSIRWQASSHRNRGCLQCCVHSKSLWERACPRLAITGSAATSPTPGRSGNATPATRWPR